MNVGVILSGGRGVRAGSVVPKQYFSIHGRMLIDYVAQTMLESPMLDKVVMCGHKDYFNLMQERESLYYCEGGVERNISVYNALNFIRNEWSNCDFVVFADAARPFLTENMIEGVLKKASEYRAAVTVQKIIDSLGKKGEVYVERKDYYLIQTPEAFKFSALQSFDPYGKFTAIAQQADCKETGLFETEEFNLKITYKSDFTIAEKILEKP